MLVNFAIGQHTGRRHKHVIPERARAQLPCDDRIASTDVADKVDLPVASGVRSAQAWIAQRKGELGTPLLIQRELSRQLVKVTC